MAQKSAIFGSGGGAVKGGWLFVFASPAVGYAAGQPPKPQPMDSRIQELEIRVAFQDDMLTTLSGQMHTAHQELARLRAELVALRERVDGLKAGAPGNPGEEPPPPHY